MRAEEQTEAVAALRDSLRRHPPDQRPLQHATAMFHLATVLLEQGELDEAEACFANAAALFAARGARTEEAKALNGVGATLREAGRAELAARAFDHAAAVFAAAGLALEEGAARFNRGLVLRESGQLRPAAQELDRARSLLEPAEVPAQAAAAARELGATLLELGDLSAADAVLVEAAALSDRAADAAGRGAAANVLGLVRLAEGRAAEAVEWFRTAAAASPRSLRPEAFAMAKGNLAHAHEQAGDLPRARLAARQALSVKPVADPVQQQAEGVLARLGTETGDLGEALETEAPELRAAMVREELARTSEAGADVAAADMRAWTVAVTASGLDAVEVAELWLGGLLELPPDRLERLAWCAVAASGELEPERRDDFRAAVARAMARFHVPQLMRLQDVFSRAAESAGDRDTWR